MNDHEKKIKEQRTSEATRKNFMGFEGKIGCIVRNLGQPIVSQQMGGTYFDSTPFDFWENLDDGELNPGTPEELCQQIPTIDADVEQPEGGIWMERQQTIPQNIEHIGWYFQGISSGMELEIKYIEENRELIVEFKSKTVYKEIAGDLESYVPMDDWENMIDKLFESAKKRQISKNKKVKQERTNAALKNQSLWVQRMKDKWGF